MKKTVTINLAGIVFTIDEDAFDKLNNYLNTIKGYFNTSEGQQEIMEDIESRIAEMLTETLTGHKQVVTIIDIDSLIAIMGQPEDYLEAEQSEDKQHKEHRTFHTHTGKTKRIYRDGDSNVIGGVCSGIGYYFGFDPIWLRIAFVLAFFFLGSGFLVYLILWLVIPKAVTTSEKLEMKGEPVTFDTIGKTVEEELHNFKKKVNEFEKDLKRNDSRAIRSRIGNFIRDIVHFILDFIKLIIRFFGKVIGFIFLCFGSLFLLILFGSLFGNTTITSFTNSEIISFSIINFFNMFFNSTTQSWMILSAIALLIGIPLLSFVFLGIKLMFGIKHQKKGFGMMFGTMWLVGILLCVFVGLTTAKDFAKKGKIDNDFTIDNMPSDTLYLSMKADIFESWDYDRDLEEFNLLKIVEDTLYFGYPTLDITKSQTNKFGISVSQTARAGNYKHSVNRAESIHYDYTLTDNRAEFNPYYSISNDKWRNQRVHITVFVPEGKSVHLDEKMARIIYDIKNLSNTLDGKMAGKTWTMREDGLTCENCDL